MSKDRIIRISVLLIVIPLLFFNLSLKPPHSDEGVNGFFVSQVWENGFYTYDPQNYHGPLLFYLFQISEKIFGFGIHSFRTVTAFSILLSVFVILRSYRISGFYSSGFTALAVGLSPGMIFFGRSAIHEPVFVFFQILWLTGFLVFRETSSRTGLVFFFAGVLGSLLLKETFLITGLSFVVAWVWTEFFRGMPVFYIREHPLPARIRFSDIPAVFLIKIILIFLVLWLFFYTGFLHNWKGAADFFKALMPWLKTGTAGSGHDKPFYYWFKLIARYEWTALAGIVIAMLCIAVRSWKIRFFSCFALVNILIYSLIPYKTPWCVISILWPFVFVAGFFFEEVISRVRASNVVAFATCLILAFVPVTRSAFSAYNLNYINYENPSEPYVYVQTKNDFRIIEEILNKRTEGHPELNNMTIILKINDPWPFPWFLSGYPNLRFADSRGPSKPEGDIIISEMDTEEKELAGLYMRRRLDIREARKPVYIYLRIDAFKDMSINRFEVVRNNLTEKS